MRGYSVFVSEVIHSGLWQGASCVMARCRIGQEALALPDAGQPGRGTTLDGLATLIDRVPVQGRLKDVHATTKGEPAWPPPASSALQETP